MQDTHKELLAAYMRAANRGNWFGARQIANSAGCGLMSDECSREDFTPEQKKMWLKLFHIAFERKTDEWQEYRRELWREID